MSLIAEALYQLEEQAGIMEFDGEATRAEAEEGAIAELQANVEFSDSIKQNAIRIFRVKSDRPPAKAG